MSMIVTFVAHTTRLPAGGLMALFEFAGGLCRRGHRVQLVHRWHPFVDDKVQSLNDISWFQFDDRIHHHFVEDLDEFPAANFIFWAPSAAFMTSGASGLPPRIGLPLMLVQGDLTGTEKLASRMRAPFPKVCVAKWLVAVGRNAGVPDHQLFHVPYGIDHRVYRLTAPIEGRPMQVAMLYHRHPKKGVRDGLEALDEVRRRLPEARAVLFGTREPDDPLPPWIAFRRAPDRESLVREVYNQSRVFLQPSIREGFGFTPVEAMAGGCALATTSNGGSDDYAIHDQTALVTEPRDVLAMATSVERLLRDDETRVRLAVRGNEYVKRFDWDRSAALLEQALYDYRSDPNRYQQSPVAT